MNKYINLWILIGVCAISALVEPRFLGPTNLINISNVASILLIAALAQMLIILLGEIDLSMGSVVALVSMVTVMTANQFGIWYGFLAGIAAGGIAGLLNGFITSLGVPSFITTVAALTYMAGIARYISGGIPVESKDPASGLLGSTYVGPIPLTVLIAACLLGLIYAVTKFSQFGRVVYFIGSNKRATLLSGVNISRSILLTFTVSGTLTGLAGIILASRVHSGQPELFPTLAFEAIGAIALGGIPLTGGRGSVWQVLSGVIIYSVIKNALTLANFSSQVQQVILGLILILAVTVSMYSSKRTKLGVIGA
ncbi:ABC transporter permease [Paenibacillus beijingensis]|uniref:ABC transporter permease n=1 Tax=Paenibacillus beijingensis TaxID=1126833 RepID=UPI0006978113|nr:ABC transporter permease [Paenibacillus beijingensis]